MATKCFCDNCGSENAGRVTVAVARSEPIKIDNPVNFDTDLCQRCFDALVRTIRPILTPNKS